MADNLQTKTEKLIKYANEKFGTNEADLRSIIDSAEVGLGGEYNLESIKLENGTQKMVATKVGKKVYKDKDVKFIDPYGNVVTSISIEEAQTLTQLPQPPIFEGLVFQEWNWTLEEINSLTAPMVIGANYITEDGTTRVYIELNKKTGLTFTLATGGTIYWGDGTVETYDNGTKITHTYSSYGKYKIIITGGSLAYNMFGQTSTSGSSIYSIRKIEIGNLIQPATIPGYSFYGCNGLESITIPANFKCLSQRNFAYNPSLKALVIPRGNTGTETYATLYLCYNDFILKYISMPYSLTKLYGNFCGACYLLQELTIPPNTNYTINESQLFINNHSLKKVYLNCSVIPRQMFSGCKSLSYIKNNSNVTEIGYEALWGLSNLKIIDFSNNAIIPTIDASAIRYSSGQLKIIVPDALYDEWIVATNWAEYEPYIYRASEVNI